MKEEMYKKNIRDNRRIIRIMAIAVTIIGILSRAMYFRIIEQERVIEEQQKIIEEHERNMTGATLRLVQLETEIESRNRSGV